MRIFGVKPFKILINAALFFSSILLVHAMAFFMPYLLSIFVCLEVLPRLTGDLITNNIIESLAQAELDQTEEQANIWGKSDKIRSGLINKFYAWLTKNIFKPLANNVSFKAIIIVSSILDGVSSLAIAFCYVSPYAWTFLLSVAAMSVCISLSANFIGYFAYYREFQQSKEEQLFNNNNEELIQFCDNKNNCLTDNLSVIKTALGNDFDNFRTICESTLDKIIGQNQQITQRHAYLALRAFIEQIIRFNDIPDFSDNPIIKLINNSITEVLVKPETGDRLLSDDEKKYLNNLIVLFTTLSKKESEPYINRPFRQKALQKQAAPLNYKFNELSQRKVQPEHIELQKGIQPVSGKFSLVANNLLLLKNEPENQFACKN